MTKDQIARYLSTNSGTTLISEERNRQIESEGYNWEHDDSHTDGELALAGAVYAIPSDWRTVMAGLNGRSNIQRLLWPWEWESFKPKYIKDTTTFTISQNTNQRIKELVKAGALIAAEIDRLQRIKIKNSLHNSD